MRAIGLALACLALPACASAGGRGMEAGPGYDRAGAYIAAAGLVGLQQFDVDSPLGGGNAEGGAAFRLGYRGEEGAAIELFVEDARGFEYDFDVDETELEMRSAGVQGKLYMGSGRLQPYVLAGAGWARAHFRDRPDPRIGNDSFFVRGGLGAECYLASSLAIFVEGNYNVITKHLDDFDHLDVLAGIVIRF